MNQWHWSPPFFCFTGSGGSVGCFWVHTESGMRRRTFFKVICLNHNKMGPGEKANYFRQTQDRYESLDGRKITAGVTDWKGSRGGKNTQSMLSERTGGGQRVWGASELPAPPAWWLPDCLKGSEPIAAPPPRSTLSPTSCAGMSSALTLLSFFHLGIKHELR